MIRATLYFCILISIFYGTESLKCYVCLGSPDSDCAKNETSAMGTQVCFKPKPHLQANRVPSADEDEVAPSVQRLTRSIKPTPHTFDVHCLYFTTNENKYGSEMVVRECAYVYHNQDICEFFKKSRKNINKCKSCDDDLCNL